MGWTGLYFEFSQAKLLSVCGSFLQRPFSCSIFFKTFNLFLFQAAKCIATAMPCEERVCHSSFEAPFRLYQNNKKVGLFMGFSASIFVLILMWCLYCAFGWAKWTPLIAFLSLFALWCHPVMPGCVTGWKDSLWWDLCFCGSKTGFPKFCCGRRKVMLKQTGSHVFNRRICFISWHTCIEKVGSFWAQRPFFRLFFLSLNSMVVTSLNIILQQGWNLFCIIQLEKMRVMFPAKFYSPGLLLKSVNRNIRSCFPDSIAFLAGFWRAAGGSISSLVVLGQGGTLVGSAGVPVAEVGAGWSLLSSKPWHELWCPGLSLLWNIRAC